MHELAELNFELPVGDYTYKVVTWEPGMPVIVGGVIAIDTETEMLVKGQAPVPVIEQVCCHEKRLIHVVNSDQMFEYNRELFHTNQDSLFLFHNAPFDLHVMGLDGTERDYLLKAVKERRVVDTSVRFILHQLACGKFAGAYALDTACRSMFNIVISKDAGVRTTFRKGMVMTKAHLEYAVKDAVYTAWLYEAMPKPFPTEDIQVWGYIALSDISNRGMLVDRSYFKNKDEELKAEKLKSLNILSCWGYYPGEAGNQTILQTVLQWIEKELGLDFPKTEKTKKIAVGDGMMEMFPGDIHPFLTAYKKFKHLEKMLSTYLNPDKIGEDGRVHTIFKPLVKTGRTSSRDPNMQNLPRDDGIRGLYIAKPGYVLYACDYAQLELCALAETCFHKYGESVMRDIINSGEDIHMWFGNKIKEQDPRTEEEKAKVKYRQMAKAANFGYPGGLGTKTFKDYAKNTYRVELTEDQCKDLRTLWIDAFPEMTFHLSPDEDSQTYYNKDEEEDNTRRYIARTISDRVRRNASFCSACNYPFQGLAADGAKLALWYLYLERIPVVNFIHDEVIVELPMDSTLQTKIARIDQLMIAGMRQLLPNVRIKVEGALMKRWYKEAEPVFDDQGLLRIWEP
ncbi:MAG: DNA polymerase [Candidatus Thorarchaeota archaeon]|jgi:DNA polymerase-1